MSAFRAFTSVLKDRPASNGAAYAVLREQPNLCGAGVLACANTIPQIIARIAVKFLVNAVILQVKSARSSMSGYATSRDLEVILASFSFTIAEFFRRIVFHTDVQQG